MKKVQSFSARLMIVLTLCAFAIPSLVTLLYATNAQASASYDADCNMFVTKKADTSQDSQKQTSGKVADDCCINHHCCTAKISFSNTNDSTFIAFVLVQLPILANQNASGQLTNGPDRPPKSLI